MDNYSNIGSFDGCGQVRPPHFHHPTAQRFQHSRGPQGPACEEGSPGNFRHFQKVQDYGRRRLQVLSKDEFTKAMRECDIGLTGTELNILFNYFDTGNDGSINLEEFIQGIRDPMNKQRLSIVILDEDENTRDESREMATEIMATFITKLTHSILLTRLIRFALVASLKMRLAPSSLGADLLPILGRGYYSNANELYWITDRTPHESVNNYD